MITEVKHRIPGDTIYGQYRPAQTYWYYRVAVGDLVVTESPWRSQPGGDDTDARLVEEFLMQGGDDAVYEAWADAAEPKATPVWCRWDISDLYIVVGMTIHWYPVRVRVEVNDES